MPARRKRTSVTPLKKSETPRKKLKEVVEKIAKTTKERRKETGVVMACGQGDVGQLGLGPDVLEKKRFFPVPDLKDVVDISAGGMHTVCLTASGEVYTFGCDDEGALGRNATDENSFIPGKVELEGPVVHISAGDSHTAVILEDGRVFAWGTFRDSHGVMGLTGPNKSFKTPVEIKMSAAAVDLASGSDHLVILLASGLVLTFGCPEQGQLGRVGPRIANRERRSGVTEFLCPIPLKKNVKFSKVWASAYGTYAKDKTGVVYRCGLNNYGQLGLPEDGSIYSLARGSLGDTNSDWVKLEGGEHHLILLDQNGAVYCLGRKEYGRLGLGENCEDAQNVTPIPELLEKKCTDIAAGSSVSFAVTEDGSVYGWGLGDNCQLSRGDDDDHVWTPSLIKAKQLEGKKVLRVAAGGQHAVILVKST